MTLLQYDIPRFFTNLDLIYSIYQYHFCSRIQYAANSSLTDNKMLIHA